MLKNMRILYVEDDDDIRDLMAQRLRRVAGELLVAENGRQGLEFFEKLSPDIVVTDVQMPEMDGLSMARAIKAISRNTPVILTTAFNEIDYLLQSIEIGIDGYVIKPIRSDLLLEALNKSAGTLYYKREMDRKNKELQQYYDAAEREHQLVAELMERIIRDENLHDAMLHSWICPATNFSGDLVTARRAPNEDLFIILADATGHGLAAAMNLLPLARTFYRMTDRGLSLPTMIGELNGVVREQSTAAHFVAVTLARVDARNRILEVWNGGNPPAVLLGADGNVLQLFKSDNLALGIVDNSMVDIHTDVIRWDEEAQLLLFSDGVPEAENPVGEPLGLDALIAAIAALPVKQRFTAAVQRVQDHLGGKAAHDDLSLIVVDCPIGGE